MTAVAKKCNRILAKSAGAGVLSLGLRTSGCVGTTSTNSPSGSVGGVVSGATPSSISAF